MRHIQTLQVKTDSNVTLNGTPTETGSTEYVLDQTIAASQTNFAVAGAWSHTTLQSIIIVADHDCTLETNSGSSPTTTISLKANTPLIWGASAGYFTNPFTAGAVTSLFVTTGTSATRLQIRALNT